MEINNSTLGKIARHIKESEGTIPHPYLDSNGEITAGVGFLVNEGSVFIKLPFQIRDKNGTSRLATDEEKAAAFQAMEKAQEDHKGDYNRKAETYAKNTNLFLTEPAIQQKLEEEVRDRVRRLTATKSDHEKGIISEAAFNKLTDAQKAAAVDIHYANGSLEGFPEFMKAIEKGDPQAMADESTFYANKDTGTRPRGRLLRNYQALSGQSQEEAKAGLWKLIGEPKAPEPEGNDNTPKATPEAANQPPSAEPPASPNPGTPEAPRSEDTRPRLDDQTHLDTQEAQRFIADVSREAGGVDAVAQKDPGTWTEAERDMAMKRIKDLGGNHPEAQHLDKQVQGWFDHVYGDDELRYDETGKMLPPQPKAPVPATPGPLSDPQGQPVSQGLSRIARKLAGQGDGRSFTQPVQHLQQGLNILNGDAAASAQPPVALKADGQFGPRTRAGLTHAVAAKGPGKVEEGLALGQFHDFARRARGGDGAHLAQATEGAFGNLFRSPGAAADGRKSLEATALQETLNDLGPKTQEGFQALKLDGRIGPKTEGAFAFVNKITGPDRLTKRFGSLLGFLA